METQNEQKANEIVDKFYGNFVPFHAHSKAFEECAKAKNAVLDAMEWKDKEWAERFKKAFEGLWTASFNVDNLSNKTETTIEFKLVTRE